MDELFAPCADLLVPKGTTPVSELSSRNVVGLYFSARWCPPCREFTRKLAEAYRKIRADAKFEVVFVSNDHSKEAFASYRDEMPWLALPFAERKVRKTLSERFQVSSMPALVLLDGKTGAVLSKDGTSIVKANNLLKFVRDDSSIIQADLKGKKFPWEPTPPAGQRTLRGHGGCTLLPVTVLSGFLGAGKTTLLKHILRTAGEKRKPMRIAVIVNDMGEINLDASDIKHSKLIQEEATMVELHNGCICCTLRGDLLKTVKALSKESAFDYLIIESTGISEPLPVAQTFVMDIDPEGDGDEVEEDLVATKVRPSKKSKKTQHDADGTDTTALKGRKTADKLETPEKISLSSFARLDTLVTVVDAFNLFDVLSSLETLSEKNSANMVGNTGFTHGDKKGQGSENAEDIDDRSIAQLMLDQIEFANVIVLSKTHLLGAQAAKAVSGQIHKLRKRIRTQQFGPASAGGDMSNEVAIREVAALIKKLNPKARVIVPMQPKFADVRITDFVNTHLFDMDEAQESAGWIAELEKEATGEGHTPETEEYGIGSVVFRSQDRPFHPQRLQAILEGFGNYKLSVAGAAGAGGGMIKNVGEGVFNGVVRAKGHLWVASANAYPVDIHIAGRMMEMTGSDTPWLAAVPREEWNEEDMESFGELFKDGKWHNDNGDRESEVVFIGVHLDKSKILASLQAALLTDAEFEGGAEAWRDFADPFFGGDYFEVSEEPEAIDHEEVEEEALGAAKKKTNVKKRKSEAAAKVGNKARREDERKMTKQVPKETKKVDSKGRERDMHTKTKRKDHKIAKSAKA